MSGVSRERRDDHNRVSYFVAQPIYRELPSAVTVYVHPTHYVLAVPTPLDQQYGVFDRNGIVDALETRRIPISRILCIIEETEFGRRNVVDDDAVIVD